MSHQYFLIFRLLCSTNLLDITQNQKLCPKIRRQFSLKKKKINYKLSQLYLEIRKPTWFVFTKFCIFRNKIYISSMCYNEEAK